MSHKNQLRYSSRVSAPLWTISSSCGQKVAIKLVIKIVLLHLLRTQTSDSLALKTSEWKEGNFYKPSVSFTDTQVFTLHVAPWGNETTNVISRSRDGVENTNRLVRVNLICSVTLRGLGHKHMLTNCCLDKQINTDKVPESRGMEDALRESRDDQPEI